MSPPLPVLAVIGHSSRDKLTFFFPLPFLGPETFSHSSACLTSCSATVDPRGAKCVLRGIYASLMHSRLPVHLSELLFLPGLLARLHTVLVSMGRPRGFRRTPVSESLTPRTSG